MSEAEVANCHWKTMLCLSMTPVSILGMARSDLHMYLINDCRYFSESVSREPWVNYRRLELGKGQGIEPPKLMIITSEQILSAYSELFDERQQLGPH